MKKTFSRAISVLCALAMVISCLSASMFAFAADNLALDATVIVGSIHGSYAFEPSTINDGVINGNSRWQSLDKAGESANEIYVGLVWDEAITANTFVFYWETSHPGADFEIYVATAPAAPAVLEQTRFTETCYNQGNTVWTKLEKNTDFSAIRADHPSESGGKVDTITLKADAAIYAIKYVVKSAGNSKFPEVSCYEAEAYKEDINTEPEDPATKNWAFEGTIIADSEQNGMVAANANDGDKGSRWQSSAKGNNGDDAWIGLQLAEAVELGKLVLVWETAHPATDGFKVQVSEDGAVWNDVDFTVLRAGVDADDKQADTITLDAPVTTAYIRVLCQKAYVNGSGAKENPSVYEFEAYAPAETDGTVTAETAAVDGVKSVFVATAIAEEDIVGLKKVVKAEYTITKADGTKATGEVIVTAAYEVLTLSPLSIASADYVTGVHFVNVPEDATVTVAFSIVDSNVEA